MGVPERVVGASKGSKTVEDLEHARRPGSYLAPPPFGPGGRPVQIVGSVGIQVAPAAKPKPPRRQPTEAREYRDDDDNIFELQDHTDDDGTEDMDQNEETEDTSPGVGQVRHQFPRNEALTPEIAFVGR